ncbi:hypothetical protein BMS3Abin08_01606 [bacterium BMS3Abin08]|nr:hypothetical protein BMS3Abin08_01606 [bacterium BMS3Abin08]HDL21229.1 DUF86 domain-containing protein [Nitrospirota bacterium]
MYDRELVVDILHQIDNAIDKILYRFSVIKSANDFTDTPEGMEKLDSICMQLIAIGESLKNIDKIAGKSFLSRYGGVDWKGIKGMRDIITHHYFDIDAEAIFEVCRTHIPKLKEAINIILSDIKNNT